MKTLNAVVFLGIVVDAKPARSCINLLEKER
jgi:hypothetical protein